MVRRKIEITQEILDASNATGYNPIADAIEQALGLERRTVSIIHDGMTAMWLQSGQENRASLPIRIERLAQVWSRNGQTTQRPLKFWLNVHELSKVEV